MNTLIQQNSLLKCLKIKEYEKIIKMLEKKIEEFGKDK
jgi:hypothetical protein